MVFVASFFRYLLIFIILAAVAGIGIFAGKKLSDRSEAKKAAEAEKTEEVK